MNIIQKLQYRYRLGSAVREALDSLPSAVCYFTRNGSIKLCNSAMYALYRELTRSDLQSHDELKAALDGCDGSTGIIRDGNIFLFPDGHARQYSEREITTEEGRTYTEAVFSDVTELYEKRRDLQRQSSEMKRMYGELKTLSGQLTEVTREQEILNMKALLHDQMNMGIAAIRQILRQNNTSEENAAAVARFRRAIQILQEEGICPQDELSEFIRDAEVAGVEVVLEGALADAGEDLRLLVEVLREACVNAARHADASALNIAAETENGTVRVRITNDGRPPKEEITPRGGLKDLGRRIEQAGGSMEIRSLPEFMLMVTLPLKERENGEEARK